MKKHIVLIVNIVLIVAIAFGVGISVYNSNDISQKNTSDDVVPTQAIETAEQPTTVQKMFKIGIVQHSNIDNSNNAYRGFITELASRGYVNNNNIKLDYVLEEDNVKCEQQIQRLVDEKCDLIYAIGPFAAKLAAQKTSQIPIVFGAVSDPEEEGLVESNEKPNKNVTGVSDYIPCFEQIDTIKLLLPDKKKIGALYTASNESSVMQAIIAEKEAQTSEVNLAFEKYPVKNADEIYSSLSSMPGDGVDVIYVPIDNFVYSNLDTVVEFSHKNKIPVICGNTKMLEKGCFSTCEVNYSSIGKKAVEMSLDILLNNESPANMPVAYKYDCYIHVNESSAKKLGITIPEDIKSEVVIN